MPKEQRRRVSAHAPSAKVKHVEATPAEPTLALPVVQPTEGVADGGEKIEAVLPLKKKEKQQLKKDAFLERLGSAQAPYSKSHMRRLKRKARDQLATGLGDMQEAITALQDPADDAVEETIPPTDKSSMEVDGAKPAAKTQPARIGQGKGATLSKAQRKRALEMEKLRHPLILANPQFSTNPFETIRTHAQNTLLKHVPPATL